MKNFALVMSLCLLATASQAAEANNGLHLNRIAWNVITINGLNLKGHSSPAIENKSGATAHTLTALASLAQSGLK